MESINRLVTDYREAVTIFTTNTQISFFRKMEDGNTAALVASIAMRIFGAILAYSVCLPLFKAVFAGATFKVLALGILALFAHDCLKAGDNISQDRQNVQLWLAFRVLLYAAMGQFAASDREIVTNTARGTFFLYPIVAYIADQEIVRRRIY